MIYISLFLAIGAFALGAHCLRRIRSAPKLPPDYHVLIERVRELESAFEDKEREREHLSLHWKVLTDSIIMHLSASGNVYTSRIWETYAAEMKEVWETEYEDEPWPSYMPIVGNPAHAAAETVLEEDFNAWRSWTRTNCLYNERPDLLVTSDYVYELERKV